MDARSLLRAKKAEARVDHPYAAYSAAGVLRCSICAVPGEWALVRASGLLFQLPECSPPPGGLAPSRESSSPPKTIDLFGGKSREVYD